MFNSPNKLVLCATSNSLLAGLWRAGKLQGSQAFNNDEAGHEAFATFLSQYKTTPVYLMADAVEEDYRLESIPHATGAARNELITRKLNQFYRGLEYRTAHFVNRETDKRKDDKFLFVALNNADFLQAWVNLIQEAKVQLAGIYLLPMLSQVIVKQLKLMAPHILLCEKLSSGLRQTYLHNGRLRMSRLVPNVPTEESQLAYFYLVETEKTRLYLMSQRFITRETPLNLVLASLDGTTEHISRGISQEQNLECTDVNLSQITKSLNLNSSLIEQMPELLHMHLLASGQAVDNLAPEALTKEYDLGKLKRNIKLAALGIGVLGLATAGGILMQGMSYQSSLKEATQDTQMQQRRYDEAAKNFPVTTISADDLKVAVELDKTIATYPKSPRRTMQVVSQALEQVPEIQLDRLRWALTSDMSIKDDDKLISLPANTATTTSGTFTADLTKLYELAYVTAEISDFKGDYRSALNSVHKFVEKLKANPQVAAIEVLQEPVNVSSFVNLQGTTTDEQATQTQPALFKLKVILNAPEASADRSEIAMKLEKKDWQRLQIPIAVLVVVVLAIIGLCAMALKFSGEQEAAMKQQQNLLNSAKQRFQSSGIEKETITEYLPKYQTLINKGFVGEERRLEWVDELRKQHQQNKLFSIKYSIGLQEAYKPSFATSMGGFVLNRSVMTVDLDMLHEEDILKLTEGLSQKDKEVFMLRDCEITRFNAGGALSTQLIANLHAKCELDWLTLREPLPIQAATTP